MSEFNTLTYHVRQAPLDAAKAKFLLSGNFITDIPIGVGAANPISPVPAADAYANRRKKKCAK